MAPNYQPIHKDPGSRHELTTTKFQTRSTVSAHSGPFWCAKRILCPQQLVVYGQVPAGHVHWPPAMPSAECVPGKHFSINGTGTVPKTISHMANVPTHKHLPTHSYVLTILNSCWGMMKKPLAVNRISEILSGFRANNGQNQIGRMASRITFNFLSCLNYNQPSDCVQH